MSKGMIKVNTSHADERYVDANRQQRQFNRYIEVRNCRPPVPKRCPGLPDEGVQKGL